MPLAEVCAIRARDGAARSCEPSGRAAAVMGNSWDSQR